MNLESLSLLLLLLLSLSSFLLHPTASSPTDKLNVKTICEKSKYHNRCKSLVRSMTPGLRDTDPATIVKLHLTAAAANNHDALIKATALAIDLKTDLTAKSALNQCIAEYKTASDSMENANKALAENNKNEMMKFIGSLLTSYERCDDTYRAAKLTSPLKEYAETNKYLANNGLKIVDVFWPPSPPPSESDKTPSPVPSVPSSATGSLDIKTVCNKSQYPDLCISSVESVATDPLDSTSASAILQLAIQATVFNTQAAMDKAKVFAKASNADQRTKDILVNSCAKEYAIALGVLEEAGKAVERNDELGMKSNFVGLISHYIACGNAFEGARLPSVMTENDDMLKKLAENNLAIAKSIWPDAGWN